MYELNKVGERSYYIDCPAKIGIYISEENSAYLIDSGNDKDAAKKVRKILDEHNWKLKGILNTHSNADHIGGNQYLQQQTNCKIFADGIEGAFTQYPILEPSFLYGGYPCKDLRHKFLLAKPSKVTCFASAELTQLKSNLTSAPLTSDSGFSDIDFPKEIEIIPLPGHFFDMVGFRTPDNVVFLADCLSSKETLDKYRIGFIYDVAEYLKTLETIKTLNAKMFVPAHAPVTDNISELAEYNISVVNSIAEDIVSICKEPLCFEKILQRLFTDYNLTMNFEQYVLVGSTVRSYLSWLKDTERLSAVFEDNMLLWKAV